MGNLNILLVGPWVGEFGWELFCWQGYIRKLSKNYNKTYIITRKGNEFLYEDFIDGYFNYDPIKNKILNAWNCDNIDDVQINYIKKKIKYTTYIDGRDKNVIYNYLYEDKWINFKNQEFIKYKSDSLQIKTDILIHPRNKNLGAERNWDKKKWEMLINLLKNTYKIGIIGTYETYNLDYCDDYRNIPLKDTISLMNNTRLVVGPSSGPIHLASLCGTPHLLWNIKDNRKRYLKDWNPFNTKCYFYSDEGWNPKMENIYNIIKKNI